MEKVSSSYEKDSDPKQNAIVIKVEIEEDLKNLQPLLESATDAIKSINKNDINELKSFAHPPENVNLTMKCVCIVFGVKPKKTAKSDGYWEESQKLLADPQKFLEKILGLDINKVSEDAIKKLKEIFESNPQFQIENVKKTSKAAAAIYTWVKSMYNYYLTLKKVNSKKEALQKQEAGEKEEIKTDDLKAQELKNPKIEKEEEKKENHDEKIAEKDDKTVEQSLDEIKPILEAAVEQINGLNKNSITEMKSLANPPIIVGLTMHLVSLLLENNPQKKPKKNEFEWKNSQKLMNNSKFLERLITFDKDSISEEVMKQVSAIIKSHPDFQPEIVCKSSLAAKSLCTWVLAICKYHEITQKLKKK